MKQLGHLPRRGESLTIAGLQIRVMRADRRRVEMLKVKLAEGVELPGTQSDQGA